MTNPSFIEAKKAEASKKIFRALEADGVVAVSTKQTALALGEIIDTLLDEIQEVVVPMEALPSDWDDDDKPRLRASMYNQCRKDVVEAFQHLRTGVETEV